MNKTKIIFILLIFMILPSTIHAACTEEEKMHFKEIEDQYTVKYKFNVDTKDYTLIFTAPEPDMYDYYLYNNTTVAIECTEIDDNVTECYHVIPGEQRLDIIGQTDSCNEVLKDATINLPEYNYYYEDPLCIGIEEFVLCQPDYDKKIDYETFVSRVNAYKKTKAEKEQKEQNVKEQSIDKIVSFIKDNLLYVIAVPILLIAVIITIILTAKSIRKSRRLE